MTPISPYDVSIDAAPSTRAPRPAPAPQLTTSTMEAFACLAERCPDTCCRDWAVPIDRTDLDHMKASLSKTAEGRDRLVRLVVLGRPSSHAHGIGQLQMDDRGACPMLEPDNRCGVHATLGEEALTTACSVFPRTALAVAGHVEVGGSLGCPEVARLTLLSEQQPRLRPATAPMLPRPYIGKTIATDATNAYAHYFIEVREALSDCFHGAHRLATQLLVAADLAERVQSFFHADTHEFDGPRRPFAERRLRGEIADTKQASLREALDRDLANLDAPGEIVTALVWTLLSDRMRLPHSARFASLLARVRASAVAEDETRRPATVATDGESAALWRIYERRRAALDARVGPHGALIFRNYCQHFLMRNPYTDSATLIESLYRLSVHLAAVRLLTVLHPDLALRLSAPADPELDRRAIDTVAVEVVQTFTKAIGHHPDYLDAALHRGALQSGGFTFGRLVLLAKFV